MVWAVDLDCDKHLAGAFFANNKIEMSFIGVRVAFAASVAEGIAIGEMQVSESNPVLHDNVGNPHVPQGISNKDFRGEVGTFPLRVLRVRNLVKDRHDIRFVKPIAVPIGIGHRLLLRSSFFIKFVDEVDCVIHELSDVQLLTLGIVFFARRLSDVSNFPCQAFLRSGAHEFCR